MDEEISGEDDIRKLLGEGQRFPSRLDVPDTIVERTLAFEEASKCLNTLGKDESGVRYAYLMISPTDRKLTNIGTILNFKHLLFVDVSGNFLNLEALQILSELPYVLYIKAQRNLIESAALKPMPYLQVLSLARNRITETCDINQPMLNCLDLNYNEIYTPQFDIERTEALKQLEMRGNQMFDISGTFPLGLENLYLAENRISKIVDKDLAKLVHLKILHLRNNQIRKLNGFSATMVNLKYLNLRENKINKVRQLRKLGCLPSLETLIILQNPVSGEPKGEGEGDDEDEVNELDEEERTEDLIRVPILVLLSNLKRINKVPVTHEEREEANENRDERYEEIMNEESSEDEAEEPTTTEYTTDYTTEVEETQDTTGPMDIYGEGQE